jgi:hypothetical protein
VILRIVLATALLVLVSFEAGAQSPSLVGIPQSTDPTCSTGEYYLSVLTSGSKWRKCENGTWSDIGAASGSGEANTASNLGGGLSNYDSKSGVDLRFNSFNAAHFDLATNVISVDEPGLESLLDLPDFAGLLPLAKITDDATSGRCLLSGGGGGDPAWTTCPGGGSGTELDQTAGETDLRYDATLESYYYDVDGDGARDTNGTEPFVDTQTVQVPGDYATVQAALDSEDCKKGTSFSGSNQGCRIVVANGTYAQSFEVGGPNASAALDAQNSILIEGASPAGTENGAGHQQCAVTFTGDNTANNTVVKVNNAIGFTLRNICIDMDEAATNDPLHGIEIGYDAGTTKLVTVENVSIEDGVVAGGAGIVIGDAASSDTPFVVLRKVRMEDVQTCLEISSNQAVDLEVDQLECASPDATLGGVSITSAGGEILLRNFYFTPGIADQIGINIRNEAVGALIIERPTFEWSEDDGTMINFDATGNTGAYRATTIIGGRFQPQTGSTSRRVCIDWNRRGTLNVIGNSFESSNLLWTCEIDINNPDGSKTSDVYWVGNDTQWVGTQSDLTVNRTTSGGEMRVVALDDGEVAHCTGAGSGITATSTGCYGTGPTGPLGSWDFANGLTAADFAAASLTAADAAADLATQAELEALTLPNSGQTDDRLVKTNGTAGDLEGTGISVDASNNVDGVGTLDTDGAITGPSVATDRPSGTNRSSLTLLEGTTHGTDDFEMITPSGGFTADRTCTLQDDATPFDDCVTPGGGGGNSVEVTLALNAGAGFYSTTVTGQAWVASGSEIVCTPFGTTADGLTPEAIAIGALQVSTSDRVVGTGFNLNVYSPNGLEGTIRAHCVGV